MAATSVESSRRHSHDAFLAMATACAAPVAMSTPNLMVEEMMMIVMIMIIIMMIIIIIIIKIIIITIIIIITHMMSAEAFVPKIDWKNRIAKSGKEALAGAKLSKVVFGARQVDLMDLWAVV